MGTLRTVSSPYYLCGWWRYFGKLSTPTTACFFCGTPAGAEENTNHGVKKYILYHIFMCCAAFSISFKILKVTKFKFAIPFLIAFLVSSCGRQMWGDNDLGDNFSLLEGDRIEDRIIVYCSGRSGGACMAGTYIVPVYSRHMDSAGHYVEYVETAKSNDDFIVAKTLLVKDKTANYWIINKDFRIDNCDKINCDSLIQSHVIGPLDKGEFQKKSSELQLNLKLDKN